MIGLPTSPNVSHAHDESNRLNSIRHIVHHASHYLPSQGPIRVFVHHNTLHAFEEYRFEVGVLKGLELLGCEPYFSEERYRDELRRGRIRPQDVQAVLREELGEHANESIGPLGTRLAIRESMLRFAMNELPERELQWVLAETDALKKFQSEVDPLLVRSVVEETRREVVQHRMDSKSERVGCHESNESASNGDSLRGIPLSQDFSIASCESWSQATWEAFTLHEIWRICDKRSQQAEPHHRSSGRDQFGEIERPAQLISRAIGFDVDSLVHEHLIRFCSAFTDQGFATWQLPDRDAGLLGSFIRLYSGRFAVLPNWLHGLRQDLKRLQQKSLDPTEWILDSLESFGIQAEEQEAFILKSLLALRGWAGMIWQMETNAPWTPIPAKEGSLLEFLAVRLLLDKHAVSQVLKDRFSISDLKDWRKVARRTPGHRTRHDRLAFAMFQIAQGCGWSPPNMQQATEQDWARLVQEIDSFSSLERRRTMHLAYERKYRNEALDAVSIHSAAMTREHVKPHPTTAKFQVITCIDDREESFRRHLEEFEPRCETFGAAGFFAVVMYYRGVAEAHYRPLCPINIVPKHYVLEEPVFSASDENERRSQRRKMIGQMSHQVHSGSRTMFGGLVTGLFGSLATFPLVARILAPRITSRIRDSIGGFVRPTSTELHLQRVNPEPGADYEALGYTIPEMAGIVVRILQDIGLLRNFSPIVLFLGHGSSSLNNPHESAYNCGACSGGRGGPNARAFAFMANDPQVRKLVAQSGIDIPDEVRFVGGYHNTCNDRVDYYDLDQLPRSHRALFREMEQSITEARRRNAQERARRFESAPLSLTPEEALEHVEERAEDLSQARPEYNHATNALCFVGQRKWSRGLFLDRRAFLASYDPSIDDANGKIVERILQAAIPVCGGISLEYYFSTVDPEGHGCGSKLPHNITSLAGVMTGAASDLRPGLSQQMVEIHEPMRILFVIQTNPTVMHRIIQANAAIKSLVEGDWVQLALLDADSGSVLRYVRGDFVPYVPEKNRLPQVEHSGEWYRGNRDNLGFAEIVPSPSKQSLLREQGGAA